MDPSELPPPSTWQYVPSGFPPAGQTINFTDPEDRGYILIVVGSVLTALMVIIFCIRTYVKIFILKRLQWDDLTCTIAFFGALTYFGAVTWSVVRGPVGKHMWDTPLSQLLSNDFLIAGAYLGAVLPTPILYFLKLTLLLLYLQLFGPMRWLRISAYIGILLLTLFYVTFTIVMFVLSTPGIGQTWVTHAFSAQEAYTQYHISVPLAAVGFVFDVFLLILPLIAIARLQMPTKRKLAVSIIFLSGLLACIASLLSLYYRVVDNMSDDITWTTENVIVLVIVEMDVGIMVTSMTTFSKFIQHHATFFATLKSTLASQFSRSRTRVKLVRTEMHSQDSRLHQPSEGSVYQMDTLPLNGAPHSSPAGRIFYLGNADLGRRENYDVRTSIGPDSTSDERARPTDGIGMRQEFWVQR